MSLINIEDDSLLWLSEFSSLERLSNTINGEISQRDDTTSVQGMLNFFILSSFI